MSDRMLPYSPAQSYASTGAGPRSPAPYTTSTGTGTGASHPPTSFRPPTSPGGAGPGRPGLSLDMRTLSMRDGSAASGGGGGRSGSPASADVDIRLAPIRGADASGDSPYALPPISAMGGSSDSAAVLRRLRMDDDSYPRPGASVREGAGAGEAEGAAWARRHSLSTSYVPLPPFAK